MEEVVRLLIADTQPDWCEFSREVLSKAGYEVSIARDVETLRGFLRANGYDLILVNIELMKQDFGVPIHEFLMANLTEPIVVIAMPGWGPKVVQETRVAFKAGAADCVDKPLSPERLLFVIRQLLHEFREQTYNQSQGVQLCHS